MRKYVFCIFEIKSAVTSYLNSPFGFCYIDSTIPLLPKSLHASSNPFGLLSMQTFWLVGGLFGSPKTFFLATQLTKAIQTRCMLPYSQCLGGPGTFPKIFISFLTYQCSWINLKAMYVIRHTTILVITTGLVKNPIKACTCCPRFIVLKTDADSNT